VIMGNSSSRKRKQWSEGPGSSTDVEPRVRDFSPWRKSRSEQPSPSDLGGILDVPSKPGKAIVTLTNLQSEKPSGSCVTDSIYLDWKPPAADGGRPILGYSVEMYDLPTGNWVTVTQTDDEATRSVLDNILCGIMYRFRVRAFNEIGNSIPGIPSDAFVIDTPGVHIAPYFILCPPPEAVHPVHDTVQFRAKALGTPRPNILWQKDEDPIFITEGIEIEEETDGSTLTVHNLQLEDQGLIQCVAVNHVGKAVASTELCVFCVPRFAIQGTSTSPGQFTFRAEEMVRLKFPILASPAPHVQLLRNTSPLPASEGDVCFRDGAVIVRMGQAKVEHTGEYKLTADNGHGKDEVNFIIDVEVPPDPPGQPEVLDVTPSGQLSLAWDGPQGQDIDHFIVEYYRDQWQLWLRMKTCLDTNTVITDLIPGSKYKFRVMSASIAGISEASPESEEVMIGSAPEDELFDLPRGRQPGRRAPGLPRKMLGLDRSSLDRSLGAPRGNLASASPDLNRRHVSLDREVYYDSDNVRRDVVAFNPDVKPEVEKLGHLSGKYKLSNDEMSKYKTSLSQLCRQMKMVSNTSQSNRSSRTTLDATHHLKMEVSHTRLSSSSLSHLGQNTLAGHIERDPGTSPPPSSVRRLSSDVDECRKSLTDIRDRIGSLQSLLKESRALTASKQHLFPELPSHPPPPPPPAAPTVEKLESGLKRKPSRSLSYSQAMDSDSQYQETHFPYSPEASGEGSTSLLCDKPENRQSGRSPLPEPSPKVGRSPSFNLKDREVAVKLEEQQAAAEARSGGSSQPGGGSQLGGGGGGGAGLGALRELGEQLVAEQENEVEEGLLKPNGDDGRSESTMSCRTLCESVTSCQTLCASSTTDLVDTENTPFIDRLVSSSSQGTLVESDCELLEDDIDNDRDFEL